MTGQFLKRECEFHNRLAESDFRARWLVHRATTGLYDASVYWEPVWSRVQLRGKTVVDLGCGSGWMVAELARRGAFVVGLDISGGLLQVAQARLASRIAADRYGLILADAHRLPFPDGSFDYVFFNTGILHHLDFEQACAEVARILRPGGQAFFVEPLNRHPLVRLFRRLTPKARTPDERPLDPGAFAQAQRYFRKVSHTEYYVVTVFVAALNLISPTLGRLILPLFRAIDNFLLARYPGLGRYAWIVRLELATPRVSAS